jgi:broad specificity phosphatase PhoE
MSITNRIVLMGAALVCLMVSAAACVKAGEQGGGKPGVLYLARHGQTEWNRVSRFQGDPDLDQIGYLNRVSLWLLLKDTPLQAIYTSSKRRTQRTAALVARQHKLAIRVRPALDEIHSGVLEGICYKYMQPDTQKPGSAACAVTARGSDPTLAKQAVARIWAAVKAKGTAGRVPLGENYADMKKRLAPLIPELKSAASRGNVLAVGHGLINRVALHLLLGWSLDQVHKLRQENDQVYRISGLHDGKHQIELYAPGHGWRRCAPPKKHQKHLSCSAPTGAPTGAPKGKASVPAKPASPATGASPEKAPASQPTPSAGSVP